MTALSKYFAVATLTVSGLTEGASVTIQWSTTSTVGTRGTSSLSPGTPVDGDGTLLQLGYFSSATLGSPFAGDWVVLATGSVGDEGIDQAGRFSIVSVLSEGSFIEPMVGTPLGIRFFDGETVATSSYYNTGVNEDGSGLWISPSDPSPMIAVTLSKAATVFEAGGADVFRTTIPVPEPSTGMLCVVAIGALGWRRRIVC